MFDPNTLANEELRHVYSDRRNVLIVTALSGLVTATVLAVSLDWKAGIGWYAWLLLSHAWHWLIDRSHRPDSAAMPLYGVRRHIMAAGLAGIGWGGVALALAWLPLASQSALLMMMILAVNTALPRFVLFSPIFIAFAAGVMTPLLLVLPFLDLGAQKLVALMLAVATATLWFAARDMRSVLMRILLKQVVSERDSYHDRLTGLGNRRRFDDALSAAWSQASRLRVPLSLMILDVDHFKKFNDTYGHPAGDECLKKVATALASCIRRGGDVVARYGGEEFAVLLFHTPMMDARNLGEHMCYAVRAIGLGHEKSNYGVVTISVGGATVLPSPALTPQEFVKHADNALYRAKEGGRNRVEWHL